MANDFAHRREMEQLEAEALAEHQLSRLNYVLREILPHNSLFNQKLADISLPIESLEALNQLPYTHKEDLIDSGSPHQLAANRTFPLEHYVRYHRTSGTRGRPLSILDTAEDWNWWINGWQYVLDAAEIDAGDRVMLAFSFGPFIGFWSAHDAVVARGSLVIPGGGIRTRHRFRVGHRLRFGIFWVLGVRVIRSGCFGAGSFGNRLRGGGGGGSSRGGMCVAVG